MNQLSTRFSRLLVTSAILLSMSDLRAQTCFSSGTGADGAYNATSSGTLPGGTYNFTSFTIGSGVTIDVTGTQPLVIYCTGNVTIDGSLRANGGDGSNGITFTTFGPGGIGVAGGANGGDGSFSSGSGPLDGIDGSGSGGTGNHGAGWSGGGGAGHAVAGLASGGVGGFAGPSYGNANLPAVEAGSGGGGGSGGYDCGAGGGGAGGGMIIINAGGSLTIGATGMISCNGGNGGSDGTGNCGGGGGGSGGSILLASPAMTNNGSLSAIGGTGGASAVPGNPYYGTGANGAVGRIRLDYSGSLSGTGTITPAAGSVNSLLSAAVSSTTNTTCNGGCDGGASVTGSGGTGPYTYAWAPGGMNTPSVSGLCAGTYTCTVTDANGCSTTQSVTITQPTPVVLSITVTNVTCNGSCDGSATAAASGGTAPYTYMWMPGGITTPGANGLCAGTYTIIVTDANGCSSAQTVTITQPAPVMPSFTLAMDSICASDAAFALSGGSPSGGIYSGSGVSGGNFDPSAVTSGSHYAIVYTYSDSTGCVGTASDSIYVDLCTGILPAMTASFDLHIAPNPNNGTFTILLSNITEDTKLTLMTVTGQELQHFVATPGKSTIDVQGLSTGIYLVRASNSGGSVVKKISVR